jgi:predicted ATPase
MNAMLHLDRDEPELALQRIEAAKALAAEQRIGLVLEPQILLGAVMTAQGAFEEAVACLRDGLTQLRAIRLHHYGLARMAEALSQQDEHQQALAAAGKGLEDQEQTGQRRWEPELYRLKGIALVGLNRIEEAQMAFEEALRVARKQQAKSYELRAATSLARMWGEQGRRGAARDLLAPVYSWFTEGFDTADLKDAKALLDELA